MDIRGYFQAVDYRSLLLEDHSKPTVIAIRDHVGRAAHRFRDLMVCMYDADGELPRRAAWAVSHCLEAHPELGDDHLVRMMEVLEGPSNDALNRCILRSFTFMNLPEALHGRIANASFRHLADRGAGIAVRVYAMTVLHKLSRTYPDLRRELTDILEAEMEFGSNGFRNRAGKILRNEI